MKTTLFEASESVSVLDKLSEQIFNGRLSLKICDNLEIIVKKSTFLDKEVRKIVEHYNAVAFDPKNKDTRLVVKDSNGAVDEKKTQEFVDKIVEIRKTEVDLDIEPITMDELAILNISPAETFKIRWMIDRET